MVALEYPEKDSGKEEEERGSQSQDEKDIPQATRWFTVKGAASYLGVSEPTIFRWMKDGSLSFYKVGNATRFAKESLDAVITKTTGRKEAEAAAGKCASCGHDLLVQGQIQGTGRLYFRPEKTRFWTFQEALVPIKARVCPACGYIQMHADTTKLTSLLPKDK